MGGGNRRGLLPFEFKETLRLRAKPETPKFSFCGRMDGVVHMARQKSEFVGDEGFAFTYVTLSVFL